jgi:hypothetical protein
MAIPAKMILKLAFAALATRTAIAAPRDSADSAVIGRETEDDSIALNGCYNNGPTFAEVGFQDGSFIGGPCAFIFQGDYDDGGVKRTCINGNPGDRVTLSVQRFGGSGRGSLSEQD